MNLAHTSVFALGVLLLGNLLELLADAFLVRRLEVVKTDRIKEITLAVEFTLSLVLCCVSGMSIMMGNYTSIVLWLAIRLMPSASAIRHLSVSLSRMMFSRRSTQLSSVA